MKNYHCLKNKSLFFLSLESAIETIKLLDFQFAKNT